MSGTGTGRMYDMYNVCSLLRSERRRETRRSSQLRCRIESFNSTRGGHRQFLSVRPCYPNTCVLCPPIKNLSKHMAMSGEAAAKPRNPSHRGNASTWPPTQSQRTRWSEVPDRVDRGLLLPPQVARGRKKTNTRSFLNLPRRSTSIWVFRKG